MAVSISILSSGSRGNSTFVRAGRTRVLIDCGLSLKELTRRLESIGEDPMNLDAVLVTHEHNDHAAGLRVLVKELRVEVYMTWGTCAAVQSDGFEMNGSAIVPIQPGETFTVGDIAVEAFPVPHDAAEPVAFSLTAEGVKLAQLTDVGHFSDSVLAGIRRSDVLVLESNHDLEMLRVGPYPWNLKQRLLSRNGHLSNLAVSRFLREDFDGLARHVYLAHLSSTNNHPEVARQEARRALEFRGIDPDRVQLTDQAMATEPLDL